MWPQWAAEAFAKDARTVVRRSLSSRSSIELPARALTYCDIVERSISFWTCILLTVSKAIEAVQPVRETPPCWPDGLTGPLRHRFAGAPQPSLGPAFSIYATAIPACSDATTLDLVKPQAMEHPRPLGVVRIWVLRGEPHIVCPAR